MKKKFNREITFTQTIFRTVNAYSHTEAEQKGYDIADDIAEYKAKNPDVIVTELKK